MHHESQIEFPIGFLFFFCSQHFEDRVVRLMFFLGSIKVLV
jgi:hypothetical protein